MRQPFLAPLALALAGAAAGCHTVGPRALERGRLEYNRAVVQSLEEQLLLNLVRLRYRDTPMFLEITSVSTQHVFGASAGAGALWSSGGADVGTLTTGTEYSERPTVTYAPLQGEDFVRQVLTPIDVSTIALLAQSGWSVERVLRTCVERVSRVRNAPRASGPTPDEPPVFEEFARLAGLLRRLQLRDALFLATEPGAVLVLTVDPELAGGEEELRDLRALLDLPGDGAELRLPQRVGALQPKQAAVVTRSLMGVLYFLSQSVEVPAAHAERGLVTVTRGDGAPFDWSAVTGDLLRVRSGPSRPEGAFAAVPHRGAWFWIDDCDLDSKSTFGLLAQLFFLQAGDSPSAAPLLTLPVGG